MKEIKLTKGYVALVDDEDFEELSKRKWQANVAARTVYAITNNWDKKLKRTFGISMHRMIMGNPVGMQVDHINHNGLDNRKANLRVCSTSQNKMNTHKTKQNKYGFKGVALIGGHNRTKPYRAQLRFGPKHYSLGAYSTPEEAARAYDKKAMELFGEYACLNFD